MGVTVTAPPPKAKAAPRPQAPKPPAGMSAKAKERTEGLLGWMQLASLPLMFAGRHADVGALALHGPPLCAEVAKLGDDNAKIGEAIDRFTALGPYAGVLSAAIPLLVQIGINHGRVAAEAGAQFGAVSKATLEAQVRAKMAAGEAQAKMMVLAAEREAQEAERAYQDFRDSVTASENGHHDGT